MQTQSKKTFKYELQYCTVGGDEYANIGKMMLLGARIDGREAMKIGIADYIANDRCSKVLQTLTDPVIRCPVILSVPNFRHVQPF